MTDHVVHQFTHAPGANGPGVEYLVAKRIENGYAALVYLPLATDHYRQIARRCTGFPAAHWGIEHVGAFSPKLGLDVPDQRWAAGREIDVHCPWPDARQNTLRSEGNCLHFGRARQGGEGHLTLARHFSRGRGMASTPVNKGPGALVTQVVDDQGIVRFLNIAGHTATHI